MNKILFLAVVFILIYCDQSHSATVYSTQSGDWSNTSTWAGGILPVVGVDDAVISPGDAVTISDTRTVTQTSVSGELIIAGQVTLDGGLTIGDGINDGSLTFGAGSLLAMSTYNLVLANCTIASTATPLSWATITGTGSVITSATYAEPKQNINLSYISFQNTGSISFAISITTGSVVSAIDISNCCFIGTGGVNIGVLNKVNVTTAISFENNDFRNITGDIEFTGDLTSGARWQTQAVFSGNTLSATTTRNLKTGYVDNWLIENNVFETIVPYSSNSATSGEWVVRNNLFTAINQAPANNDMLRISDQYPASLFYGNYFYAPSTWANPHFIRSQSGVGGGSGTYEYYDNVFESISGGGGDGPNCIWAGVLEVNAHHNLMLGWGSLGNSVGDITGAGFNLYNNTTYTDGTSSTGELMLFENGNYTGDINVYNNIVSTDGSASISGVGISGTASNQVLSEAGWNNFTNTITSPYSTDITITNDQTANDLSVDPLFFDNTRNLAKWNQVNGSGSFSATDGISHVLTLNGYNQTTKTQSDIPLAIEISSIAEWVQAGFKTNNALLNSYGVGGVDIGIGRQQTGGNLQSGTGIMQIGTGTGAFQ